MSKVSYKYSLYAVTRYEVALAYENRDEGPGGIMGTFAFQTEEEARAFLDAATKGSIDAAKGAGYDFALGRDTRDASFVDRIAVEFSTAPRVAAA